MTVADETRSFVWIDSGGHGADQHVASDRLARIFKIPLREERWRSDALLAQGSRSTNTGHEEGEEEEGVEEEGEEEVEEGVEEEGEEEVEEGVEEEGGGGGGDGGGMRTFVPAPHIP
ncbi:unnamed protein product [Lampetra planeri]